MIPIEENNETKDKEKVIIEIKEDCKLQNKNFNKFFGPIFMSRNINNNHFYINNITHIDDHSQEGNFNYIDLEDERTDEEKSNLEEISKFFKKAFSNKNDKNI